MTGIGLQISYGAEISACEVAQGIHANDDMPREQELFELCVERELVSDIEEGAA